MIEIIIFLIGCLSYLLDKNNCGKANLILFTHHIINIFINFGWLSNNKILLYIYVLSPITTIIHWKLNNNKCILTELHNKACNNNIEFNDLFNMLGLKLYPFWNNYGHTLYLTFCIIYVLIKLIYKIK